MATPKPESYVDRTFRSTDPRDDGRQVRIIAVIEDGRLQAQALEPSEVSPTTLIPKGRRSLIAPATLRKAYEEVQ